MSATYVSRAPVRGRRGCASPSPPRCVVRKQRMRSSSNPPAGLEDVSSSLPSSTTSTPSSGTARARTDPMVAGEHWLRFRVSPGATDTSASLVDDGVPQVRRRRPDLPRSFEVRDAERRALPWRVCCAASPATTASAAERFHGFDSCRQLLAPWFRSGFAGTSSPQHCVCVARPARRGHGSDSDAGHRGDGSLASTNRRTAGGREVPS